jgi:hypothetical protein
MERIARIKAVINIKDNYISGDIYLEIRDNEETLNIEKVNKVGII